MNDAAAALSETAAACVRYIPLTAAGSSISIDSREKVRKIRLKRVECREPPRKCGDGPPVVSGARQGILRTQPLQRLVSFNWEVGRSYTFSNQAWKYAKTVPPFCSQLCLPNKLTRPTSLYLGFFFFCFCRPPSGSDCLKCHNPAVCMYEHAPHGQA